jgi:hypothetical protein
MSGKFVLHFGISFVLGVVMSLILNSFGIGASNFTWWAVVIWGFIGGAYNFWTRTPENRLPKLLGLLAGALIGIIIIKAFFWYDASGQIR